MGHLNSNLIWHKYAESYFACAGSILEIGPQGYPTYYEKKVREVNPGVTYKALDIRNEFISGAEKNDQFIYATDPLHYPVDDHAFDIVFSDQVLAHVELFWHWYEELVRITKPGGLIITINSYSYPRCPSPIDAWRVHSDGMLILNRLNGLETLVCVTESVEMEKYGIKAMPGHYFPGAAIDKPFGGTSGKNLRINLAKRSWNNIIGKIPGVRSYLLNPVHASFDTLTVARKPLV